MFQGKSLKFKIVTSMVGLSLLTVIIICFTAVLKSSQIITSGAKEDFTMNAKEVAFQVYSEFNQVEKNTYLLGNIITSSTSIKNKSGMNKLNKIKEAEYSKIRVYTKEIAALTDWTQGVYFFFDQNYCPRYDGDWLVKENGNFKRMINNQPILREESTAWYFAPIDAKKPVWSSPYVDKDLKISMITYSRPVYKNGFLLGLVGMDITLSDLNKILENIKIYKGTQAFLVDNNFKIISGKGFNVGEDLLAAQNGKYKFLEKELKKNTYGSLDYKDGLVTKVISYSTMPNGFTLFIEVPLKNIPSKMVGTILTLMLLSIILIGATAFVALQIGDLIAKPINNSVVNLTEYSRQLSSGAHKYLDLSQRLAEGSAEQAASVQETSSTLEESASMVAQNNDNTKQAVYLAEETTSAAHTGNKEMGEMISSMNELKESSKEIAKIVKVIDDIAFQTNILALNAAVEAARAGDAGLGFAVVAEEVRNLAQKSANATKSISEIITKNLRLSELSVNTTEKVHRDLDEINSQAQKVNEILNEIAVSTNEQSVGISQITTAMNQIETVVQTNATNAEEVSRASNDLSNFAENIQSIIDEIEIIINGRK